MLREAGNEQVLRADERIRERDEERANKRRKQAAGNGNADRGGVSSQVGNGDGDNLSAAAGEHHQQQQEQQDEAMDHQQQQHQRQEQQQEQQDEAMVGSISLDIQIVDMTGWDFSEKETMQQSMETIRNRKARVIIMSTAVGSQVNKVIKCAREQRKRGLYFAVEVIMSEENEGGEAIQDFINHEDNLVSREYSVMSKKG
jgi:hypothetical protein